MGIHENSSDNELVASFHSKEIWITFLVIIDLVAFFGNLVTVVGIVCTKRFHSPKHFLLVSLSVSDLLTAMLVMPLGILNAVSVHWYGGEQLCYFWFVADLTCCSASVLNLALISLDRYWCILKPLRYAEIQTPRFCTILIVLVWLEALLTASLPLLVPGASQWIAGVDVCVVGWFFPSSHFVFLLFLNIVLPFLVMVYVYGRIYAAARKQLHRISVLFVQPNRAHCMVNQNKASRRLGVLLGVFFLCWSPYLFVTLYSQFCSMCRIHPFVVDIVTWLAWSNSCFNPILYCWLNKEYRLAYKNLFRCNTTLRGRDVSPNTVRSELRSKTVVGLRVE